MSRWRQTLYNALKDFDAPRVTSFSELMTFADDAGCVITEKQLKTFVEQAIQFDFLKVARHGIYLNLKAWPTPSMAEVSPRMRPGAIVSLHTVLGEAGIINNYSAQVHCVVPINDFGGRPNVGDVTAKDGTVFNFNAIKASVLEAGDEIDRLVPLLPYDRATPEAALVHWIYLASNHRSKIMEPDTQCDLSSIDMERLERLSDAAGVKAEVFDFVGRCDVREENDDNEVGWGPSL